METRKHPQSKQLPLIHAPQGAGHWCGPAAVRMALATRLGADARTQWELAQDDSLRTESEGNTPDRYVIRDALNRDLGTDRYGVHWISLPPTDAEREQFAGALVECIDGGWPIVATFVIRPGEPRPPGYPVPRTDGVRHIVMIYGYTDGGRGVLISDPASRSAAVSWSAELPPSYELPIELVVNLMAEKGYVA